MMNRLAALLPLLALVGVAGCARDDDARSEPGATATAASAPRDASSRANAAASAAQAPSAPESPDATFDKGAFSGTFANGRHRLELHADGSYIMDAPGEAGRGSWTHEAKDGLIRLDPGSKETNDRTFRVQGTDQLVPIADPALPPFPTLARLAAS